MANIKTSKAMAWGGLLLTVILIVVCMVVPGIKNNLWEMTDLFFLFMGAFSHLMAISLAKMSKSASGTLDRISLVCIILAIISFIVIYFILA